MNITNLFSKTVLGSCLMLISYSVFADDMHHMQMSDMQHEDETQSSRMHDHSPMQMNDHDIHVRPKANLELTTPSVIQASKSADHKALISNMDQNITPEMGINHASDHDHQKEHGGQIYQRIILDNQWLIDGNGRGVSQSELDAWIGSDENKIFIKGHFNKAESQQENYDLAALYSRNVANFWDVQIGARYRHDQGHSNDKDQVDAMFGIHGLAPYFFETEAYVYLGKDDQISLSLETERDLLLTQKWILKPYLDLNWVIEDDSKYAKQSGLSQAKLGLETRYEINKKLMPFVDIAYQYDKGDEMTAWQNQPSSEKTWLYGVGLRLKF